MRSSALCIKISSTFSERVFSILVNLAEITLLYVVDQNLSK